MAASGYQTDLDRNTSLKTLLQTKLELVMQLKDDMMQEVNCFVQKIKQDTESVISGKITESENIQDLQRRVVMATRFLRETHIETYDFEKVDRAHFWDMGKNHIEMLDHSHKQNCSCQLRNLESKFSRFVEQLNSQEEFEKRMNLKYQILEDTVHQKNSLSQSDNIKLELKMNKMEQNMQKQLDDLHKELSDVKLNAVKIGEKGSYSDQFTKDLSERVMLRLEDDIKRLTQEISDIRSDIVKGSTESSDSPSSILHEEHQKLQREILHKTKEFCEQLVENLQKDIDNTKKIKQKERGKLLNLSKQFEEMENNQAAMKQNLTEMEQNFQALEVKTEIESIRKNVDDLREKIDNNCFDIQQFWEMHNERKTVEDDLFAEIGALKYIQINDENEEKLSVVSVVMKLNFAIDALSAQIENMDDKLAQLQMKFTRGEEVYSILTADAELSQTVSKDDLIAVIRELGVKFSLMEKLILKRVDHLEILRTNLEIVNKTVIRRKELEDEVAALKTSLADLQAQSSTEGASTRCQPMEEADTPRITSKNYETSPVCAQNSSSSVPVFLPLDRTKKYNQQLKQKSNSSLSKPSTTPCKTFLSGNQQSSRIPDVSSAISGLTFGNSKSGFSFGNFSFKHKCSSSVSKPVTTSASSLFSFSTPAFGSSFSFRTPTFGSSLISTPATTSASSLISTPATTSASSLISTPATSSASSLISTPATTSASSLFSSSSPTFGSSLIFTSATTSASSLFSFSTPAFGSSFSFRTPTSASSLISTPATTSASSLISTPAATSASSLFSSSTPTFGSSFSFRTPTFGSSLISTPADTSASSLISTPATTSASSLISTPATTSASSLISTPASTSASSLFSSSTPTFGSSFSFRTPTFGSSLISTPADTSASSLISTPATTSASSLISTPAAASASSLFPTLATIFSQGSSLNSSVSAGAFRSFISSPTSTCSPVYSGRSTEEEMLDKSENPHDIIFTNIFRPWKSPLPTDMSLFEDVPLHPSSQVTEMGTHQAFQAPGGTDFLISHGVSVRCVTKHQCITAMKEYESESLEELRWKDYEYLKGDKNIQKTC